MNEQEFLNKYYGLATHVARKMRETYSKELNEQDAEDITSEIIIRLIKLAPNKREYPQYVKTVINNCARTTLAKIRKGKSRELSYDNEADCLTGETYAEVEYADMFTDGTQNPELKAARKVDVSRFLELLSEREQRLIRLNMGFDGREPLTFKQIASLMGLQPAEVSATIRRCLERMRSHNEPQELRPWSSECLICGDFEIALIPANKEVLPTEIYCFVCGKATPNRYEDIAIELRVRQAAINRY
jgi:RNA polymerase sigma factor (sigma-70 family)